MATIDLNECSESVRKALIKLKKQRKYFIDKSSITIGEKCLIVNVSDVNNEYESDPYLTEELSENICKVTGWFEVFRDGFGSIYLNESQDTNYIN